MRICLPGVGRVITAGIVEEGWPLPSSLHNFDMYDPARDIFTEAQPSSSPPPTEQYDLSALDTLAGLAAEAEIASLPTTTKEQPREVKGIDNSIQQEIPQNNGTEDTNETSQLGERISSAVDGNHGGGPEVARTKEPEMSLKVTLHLKKHKNKVNSENLITNIDGVGITGDDQSKDSVKKEGSPDQKQGSPMREISPSKVEEAKHEKSTQESPKEESPVQVSPKKLDGNVSQESRTERSEPAYPVPLSLAKLAKIP